MFDPSALPPTLLLMLRPSLLRSCLAVAAVFGPALSSSDVSAQGVGDMMSGVRDGGGWVNVPIVAGEGAFRTPTLPSMAMTLRGCVNVWPGHSGSFTIEARENVGGETIRMDAEPGVGVPFEHEFGLTAQVDFDFRWSEPRDTTLYLWVGVDLEGAGADSVCEPPPDPRAAPPGPRGRGLGDRARAGTS